MKQLKEILRDLGIDRDIKKDKCFFSEFKLFKPIFDRESKKSVREIFGKRLARDIVAQKLNILFEQNCNYHLNKYDIYDIFKSIIENLIKQLGPEDAESIAIDIENRFIKLKNESIQKRLKLEEMNLYTTQYAIKNLKIKEQELSKHSCVSELFN